MTGAYFRKESLLQYDLACRLNRPSFAKRIGNRLVVDMRKCGVDRLYLKRRISHEQIAGEGKALTMEPDTPRNGPEVGVPSPPTVTGLFFCFESARGR
jgi:hypothetical protein